MKKRIISWFMVAAMLATIVPTYVFAADIQTQNSITLSDDNGTITAARSGATIVLIAHDTAKQPLASKTYEELQSAKDQDTLTWWDTSAGGGSGAEVKFVYGEDILWNKGASNAGSVSLTLPASASGTWTLLAYATISPGDTCETDVNVANGQIVTPLSFTPADLSAENWKVGVEVDVAAGSISGGTGESQAAVVSGGTLPAGLSLSVENGQVKITGTPTAVAAKQDTGFEIKVTDSGDSTGKTGTVKLPAVVKGEQTLSLDFSGAQTVYLGADKEVTITSNASSDTGYAPTVSSGDTAKATVSAISDNKFTITPVAKTDAAITITVSSSATANYAAASDATITLTVSEGVPITGTWNNTSKTYDGDAIAPTMTGTQETAGTVTYEYCGDSSGSPDNNWSATPPKKAGDYHVRAMPGSDSTGNFTYSAAQKVTINPKEVTVGDGTFAVTKVYDGAVTAGASSGTLAVVGKVDGDTVTASGAPGAYADKKAGGNKSITISSLALAGVDADNYKLADSLSTGGYIFTGAEIKKKPVTITATAEKLYDGTDTLKLTELTKSSFEKTDAADICTGDTITVTALADAKYNSKDVHDSTAATAGTPTYDAASDAANYDITWEVNGKITILTPTTASISNNDQTVSSASSVTRATVVFKNANEEAVLSDAVDGINYDILYEIPDPVAYQACDCGNGDHKAHTQTCAYVVAYAADPDTTVTCDCSYESGTQDPEKVHKDTCDLTTGDGSKCNCGFGDEVTPHQMGCNYTAANADNKTYKTWDDGASTYLQSLAASTTVNVKVDFATRNTDSTNLAVKDLEEVTGEFKVTISSGGGHSSSGGGGTSSYTVKFDAGKNGKITKGNASTSVSSGSKVAASKVPEVTANEGYKFLGWSLDGKTTVDPTEQKITKSVTFTALYEEKPELNKEDHMAYIKGYADGTFKPGNNITRAEVAAIFGRIIKGDDVSGTASYSDVSADSWYAPYIASMSQYGLIKGYNDGTFRPDAPITREEFVAIATRMDGASKAGSLPFSDVAADRWSVDNIYTAYTNGWMKGYEDGTFRPEAKLTRAEAVTAINAMLERSITAESIADASYNTFTDVSSTHWAYYDIIEASNAHQYTKEDGKETWTK